MHIVDLAAGMSPAGSFRYLSIAVQFVEPGVRIRLQNTAEASEMALRVTGTNRMLGRVTASQIASASAASCLLVLT